MRKKWLALALALTILFGSLAGCGGCSDTGDTDAASSESDSSTDTAAEEAAKEAALKLIADELSLSEDEQANLTVERVSLYDDESVVRFTQTYQGVEIYGSSLLAAVGGDGYTAGTYYDLSDAFDDTFSTQVTAMATTPDWMTDVTDGTQTFSYDTSTATPVIYITEDEEAVLAYTVQATVTEDGESTEFELILSPDGTEIYDYTELEDCLSFTDVYVDSGTMPISEEVGIYYAYNSTYNFYAINELNYSNNTLTKKQTTKLVNQYSTKDENTETRSIHLSRSVMYHQNSDDWSNGDAADILASMQQYYDVSKWYDSHFGWKGLLGDNSLAALLVVHSYINVAGNYDDTVIAMGESVIDSPDVLAHEYAHSLIHVLTGTKGALEKNEVLALSEGICDVFAALYKDDGSWVIGGGLKDIPETEMTMDDYKYDRYNDVYDFSWTDATWLIDGSGLKKIYTNQSTVNAHTNAFIVSHVVYNIWDQVLEQDSDALGQILFRCLRYLPKGSGFSKFRDAFVYAMSISQGADAAAYASQLFTDAKIESAGTISRLKVSVPTELPYTTLAGFLNLDNHLSEGSTPDVDHALMIDKTWSEIASYDWDWTYGVEYEEGVWDAECDYGATTVCFMFGGETGDPNETPAYMWSYDELWLYDDMDSVGIFGDVRSRMSVEEVNSYIEDLIIGRGYCSYEESTEELDEITIAEYILTITGDECSYKITFSFAEEGLYCTTIEKTTF